MGGWETAMFFLAMAVTDLLCSSGTQVILTAPKLAQCIPLTPQCYYFKGIGKNYPYQRCLSLTVSWLSL